MYKEYNLANGKTVSMFFDDRGIGMITMEAMDTLCAELDVMIRCFECVHHQAVANYPGTIICKKHGTYMPCDGFCSCAERISNKL